MDGETAAATCAGRPSLHGLAERAQHCYTRGTCSDYTQFIQSGRPSHQARATALPPLAVNPRRLRPLYIAGGPPGIGMLSLMARQGAQARQLLPAAALAASTHVQERGMKLFEVRNSVAAAVLAAGGFRLGVGLPPPPPPPLPAACCLLPAACLHQAVRLYLLRLPPSCQIFSKEEREKRKAKAQVGAAMHGPCGARQQNGSSVPCCSGRAQHCCHCLLASRHPLSLECAALPSCTPADA